MGRPKKSSNSSSDSKKLRPTTNPETREMQLISLATDLAAQQLLDGTASSQVITHFLKLGTTRMRLEKEKLENETALLKAKKAALETQDNIEKKYADAIQAMKKYSGNFDEEDYIYDD